MTNEKDANVIHNLFAEYHYADDLGVIKSKLAEYVATVRREEREAAFKDAAGIARAMAVGETYETGRQKALNIAAALEAC